MLRKENNGESGRQGSETMLLAVVLFLAALIWFGITVSRG